MGRQRPRTCYVCYKTMRGDNLKRHMKQHEKKPYSIDETGCDMVGKHKQVVCKICLKKMTSNNLKRHMKKHEKKTCSIDVLTEKIEYNSTIDNVALKNSITREYNEYNRKLELGREIKQIVQELNAPTACLSKDKKEALELFENRGQVKEIKAVEWRPWQRDMLEYVNSPTQRRIIWIVGKKGNEGKTFFQDQIEEQYGLHRVFKWNLQSQVVTYYII